jgi:two-component sensor histidine kinase
MFSRHLTAMAGHFQTLETDDPAAGLRPLTLRKAWKGDELDVLCLAINAMQENLSRTYAKSQQAERTAESQARFPKENPNPVLRVSAEGVLTQANDASRGFIDHLGCSLGQRIPEECFAPLREALVSGRVCEMEARYEGRTFAFAVRPLPDQGYVNLYGLDVTERMQALEAVQHSLHEKEILLKEIHHRVKNNMQVISSLLFLQMEHVSNPADRELFAESQKRIQAMALVHEELYGAADLASVSMPDYVARLVERVLAGASVPVRPVFGIEAVCLPITRSIPCGLALNEMVMNAVKHGFPPGGPCAGEPVLRVELRESAGEYGLLVEDNGPGLPAGFDINATPTLGMTLLTGLAKQLGGDVTARTPPGGGASFLLRFPVSEHPAG